jgi:Ca-activated chloride channel family protein
MTTGSVNAPPSSSFAASARPTASESALPTGDKTAAGEEPQKPTIPADKSDRPIEIGIAYGTEKRKWLEWAVERFATTDEGWHVRVNLIPMGSLESAHAILDGDKRIHVWSPASSLYRDTLVRDWQAKHQGNPILKEEALALTPMVIAIWKGRCDAYAARCPEISLRTFRYAMELETGWDRIAQKPQWGRFKFGHTHPNQSNSGLMTLVVMAYEFHKKTSGLTVSDIMSPKFQEFLTHFERGVSKLSNSTGNLMREMVLKGPASLDAIMVYESVAIDYMESAEGRWDRLQVIYPKCNLWNENPYYILNTPWTTPAHQKAAEALLRFLMNTWVQGQALQHGFRPGNPKVPVKGLESPFVRYARTGLSVELPEVCEPPSPEVIDNLLQSWIRNAPTR